MADPIRAAGILFQSGDGRVLMLRRTGEGDHAGEWSLPGGKLEEGESPEEAAIRETREEIAQEIPQDKLVPWLRTVSNGVEFHTFYSRVKSPFVPRLNDEHDDYAWVSPAELIGG